MLWPLLASPPSNDRQDNDDDDDDGEDAIEDAEGGLERGERCEMLTLIVFTAGAQVLLVSSLHPPTIIHHHPPFSCFASVFFSCSFSHLQIFAKFFSSSRITFPLKHIKTLYPLIEMMFISNSNPFN